MFPDQAEKKLPNQTNEHIRPITKHKGMPHMFWLWLDRPFWELHSKTFYN